VKGRATAKEDAYISTSCATGVARDNQEDIEGVMRLVAPVFNAEWQVVASMSVSGPSIQITAQPGAIRNVVVEYTQQISPVLGYVRPSSFAETNSQDPIAHTLAMSQSNEHGSSRPAPSSAGPLPGVTGQSRLKNKVGIHSDSHFRLTPPSEWRKRWCDICMDELLYDLNPQGS
jgi:transcriptional regulator